MTSPIIAPTPSPSRIAYISASWHSDLLLGCQQSFLEEITSQGVESTQVEFFTVPGSLEIPLTAQLLAETRRFSVIVASGFVVDGGIYRHDFVAQAVLQGIVDVSLKTGVPVLSAVLTPHHFHEHETHSNFFRDHLVLKGKELARACLHTLQNLEKIAQLTPLK